MKRILLISAASVAFASVAAAQDAAVSLMPEVSGSAKAGNGTGVTFVEKGKTLSLDDTDSRSGEYFDFDIDIAYTWGDFTATFNVDGSETLTSDFYNTSGIEFQLTYSDGGWDYTVGSNGGDTFVEADGPTGTFGYSNDIPSVFDTTFASKVEIDGFLGSGVFPANAENSNFLVGGTVNTANTSEDIANKLNVGGSAVLAPDYAILIAADADVIYDMNANSNGDRGSDRFSPGNKNVDYQVSSETSKGLYFIDPTDTFGVVATTVNASDSKTGSNDEPTLAIGGFFGTDFGDLVARVTPTETAINASADYEISSFTIDLQLASHSFNNGRRGVDAIAFERMGSSVGVTFDAGNATHTVTIEEHGKFDVNISNLSRHLKQGGSRFISYDGDFGDFTLHVNQGTRDKTNIDISTTPDTNTSESNYLEGSQAGLFVEYNLTDDVSIGLGYATMTAEVNRPGDDEGNNTIIIPATAQRTFMDAGIKISF